MMLLEQRLTIDLEIFLANHFGHEFLSVAKKKYGFRLMLSRLRKLVRIHPESLEYLTEHHPWIMFAVDTQASEACYKIMARIAVKSRTWRGYCLKKQAAHYYAEYSSARQRIDLFWSQRTLGPILPMDHDHDMLSALVKLGRF
jgi:hypothetical protein